MTSQAAAATQPRSFAFIFPMASGHLNPSLPIARQLVDLGHEVHYLCREQMREAIEDTGAVLHLDTEHCTELYDGRDVDIFGAMESIKKEYGCQDDSMMMSSVKLFHVMLELQMPGVLRFLRQVRASAVVYCPLCNREAAWAARVLGLPSVALLTTAGPGSCSSFIREFMDKEGKTYEDYREIAYNFEANVEAVGRLNAKYGLHLDVLSSWLSKPAGRLDTLFTSSVTLVTTCEDLQDPLDPELAAVYAAEGVRFAAVGPLLDRPGARRAAGHKFQAEEAGGRHGARPEADEASAALARVRAAREAGRPVVLVSMGTVITGDHPVYGWAGREKGPNGEMRGLTGRQLCQNAWAGAFDALGAADGEDSGPLVVVSLGPQADALEGVRVPPNALCLPVLPQVDILKAGVDAFLTHGGQNSFTESLATGTPVLVCPGFGDQVVNSRKAVDLGVGLKVDRPDPDAGADVAAAARYRAEVASALTQVLAAPRFRAAAEGCAERLRLAGGVPRAVELVLTAGEPGAVAAGKATEGPGHAARAAKAAATAGA